MPPACWGAEESKWLIKLLVSGGSTGQRPFLKDIRHSIILLLEQREFRHMAVGHALPHTHQTREQHLLSTSIDTVKKPVCWYDAEVSCCHLLVLVKELQRWLTGSSVKRQRVSSQGGNLKSTLYSASPMCLCDWLKPFRYLAFPVPLAARMQPTANGSRKRKLFLQLVKLVRYDNNAIISLHLNSTR